MKALVEDADINSNDIPILEGNRVGKPMADHIILGRADGGREALMSLKAGSSPP
ncbi:hypothetical protein D1872_331520 [compost metagenome]